MPHSPEEKKRAIARLRRIRGQVDGLERAIEAGSDCGPVLQQIAALREQPGRRVRRLCALDKAVELFQRLRRAIRRPAKHNCKTDHDQQPQRGG